MNSSIQLFLATLHSALNDGESYRLELTRKADSMDVILLPILKDNDDAIPEQAKQIRSALSMPLAMMNMTMTDLASAFEQRVSGFVQAHQTATSAYDELIAKLGDATATAKNTKATPKPAKNKTAQAKPELEKVAVKVETDDKPIVTTEPLAPVAVTPVVSAGVLNF